MSGLKAATPPVGCFKGNNFMTPDLIGFYRVRGGYAELSYGTGLDSPWLYGVTVKTPGGASLDPDQSRCFDSREDAEAFIGELA